MCIYEGKEYQSDTGRLINKYDIYICDLGECGVNGSVGKTRPCVIIQSNLINEPKQGTYLIAPIRTEHNLEVSRKTLSSIVEQKRNLGRIYVPIEMDPDKFSFIDITRIRSIPYSDVLTYKCSIINPLVKQKINHALYELTFSDDDFCPIFNNEPVTKTEPNKQEETQEVKVEKVKPIKEPEISKPDKLNTDDVCSDTEMGKKLSMLINSEKQDTEVPPVKPITKLPKNFVEIYTQIKDGKMTRQKACLKLGINIYSLANLIDDYEKSLKEKDVEEKKKKNEKDATRKKSYRNTTIPSGFSLYYKRYINKEMSVKQIADKMGKHVTTIYTYINKYEELQDSLQVAK